MLDVLRFQAIAWLGLQNDLPEPRVLGKLADIERTEQGLQTVVDVLHRNAQRLGLVAMNINQKLSAVGAGRG